MKSLTAIIFSLILLFPGIGFSMVVDACCVKEYKTCCSQDFDSNSCPAALNQDDCDDIFLIIIPPNQIDFTTHDSPNIPAGFPQLVKINVYPSPSLTNKHKPTYSSYYNISYHPSIFQVFLC